MDRRKHWKRRISKMNPMFYSLLLLIPSVLLILHYIIIFFLFGDYFLFLFLPHGLGYYLTVSKVN